MKKLLILISFALLSSCGSFEPVVRSYEPRPNYEIEYNFYRTSTFWRFYFNSWGYNWNTPYYYHPFYLDYTYYPYWGSSIQHNNWYYWNRPYLNYQWNYNNTYYNIRGRSNITYVNGHRGRTSSIYNNSTNRLNLITNDQTTRSNTRTRPNQTQSSSDGGRSRSWQIVPNRQIRTDQPSNVQPRQVRRGSESSVPQQPSSSQRTSGQGRGSGRGNR
jgi:hypothetical protein